MTPARILREMEWKARPNCLRMSKEAQDLMLLAKHIKDLGWQIRSRMQKGDSENKQSEQS